MPPKQAEKKVMVKSDKLTQGEKKKIKNDNKAKANPEKAAAKKEKNDAKRAGRYVRFVSGWKLVSVAHHYSRELIYMHCLRTYFTLQKGEWIRQEARIAFGMGCACFSMDHSPWKHGHTSIQDDHHDVSNCTTLLAGV
jgi:hypothetical protein